MSQEVRANPLIQVLDENERRLGTMSETSQLLAEVARAVRSTGKKGSVTIKFTIEKDKNDEEALTIAADVSGSVPKPERRKAIVYFDEGTKTLTKTDPRQLELLAEQEAEREERAVKLHEAGIAQIGRGSSTGTVG